VVSGESGIGETDVVR